MGGPSREAPVFMSEALRRTSFHSPFRSPSTKQRPLSFRPSDHISTISEPTLPRGLTLKEIVTESFAGTDHAPQDSTGLAVRTIAFDPLTPPSTTSPFTNLPGPLSKFSEKASFPAAGAAA